MKVRFRPAALAAALSLGALAVSVGPPASAATDLAAAPALAWIERELVANGDRLPSSFDPLSPDWGLTLDAVLALTSGGRGTGTAATAAAAAFVSHVNDYITGEAFGDAGSTYAGPTGKALLSVALRGGNVNSVGGVDLEARSRARLTPIGTFAGRFQDASTFGDFSNGFGQALNIMGLARTASGVPPASTTFLLAQQCPAGGFRLTYDATAPAASTRGCATDTEADTDATSLAISALSAVPVTAEVASAVTKAADWLVANAQDATTGGFKGTGPTSAPNANSTGLAVQALRLHGRKTAVDKGIAYLASVQLDARATGTPAAADTGALGRNAAAVTTALASGIAPSARDSWRRATTQGVLGLLDATFAAPRADVVGVTPARVLETRTSGESTVDGLQRGGGVVASEQVVTLPVAGRGGVPADALAVVLNVTSVNGSGAGFVTVWACDATRPLASSVNFTSGAISANAVVSKVSAAGTVCLYVKGASTDLVVDATGAFG